jgi:hypothetical protein
MADLLIATLLESRERRNLSLKAIRQLRFTQFHMGLVSLLIVALIPMQLLGSTNSTTTRARVGESDFWVIGTALLWMCTKR